MWHNYDDTDSCILCNNELNDVDDNFCSVECKQEYLNRYKPFLTIQ